jgi:hypothetical protein
MSLRRGSTVSKISAKRSDRLNAAARIPGFCGRHPNGRTDQAPRLDGGGRRAWRGHGYDLRAFDVYATTIPVEPHTAVHESKNGVIASETNVSARKEFGAPLP